MVGEGSGGEGESKVVGYGRDGVGWGADARRG